MVGVAPDEGRGRRLPPWMMGINGDDKVKKPIIGQEKKGIEAEAQTRQPEKAIAKCETKRTRRKSSPQDTDHDDCIATVAEKKKVNKIGRKVRETASQKEEKAKRLRPERTEGSEVSSPSDGDMELTVEDLMSIAEEYVKADKEMEQKKSSSRACESESQLSMTTSSRIGLGSSLDATSNQASCTSTETLMKEKTDTETHRTGDPAKDMLDLFLGPLLKKPLEEKKGEFNATDCAFSYNLKRQRQNDNVGEEVAPPMKKKSSLKDKIAMFLD